MESAVKALETNEVVSMTLAEVQDYDWHLVPLEELQRLSNDLADSKCINCAIAKRLIDVAINQVLAGAKSL